MPNSEYLQLLFIFLQLVIAFATAQRVRGTNEEKDKIIPEEDESKAKQQLHEKPQNDQKNKANTISIGQDVIHRAKLNEECKQQQQTDFVYKNNSNNKQIVSHLKPLNISQQDQEGSIIPSQHFEYPPITPVFVPERNNNKFLEKSKKEQKNGNQLNERPLIRQFNAGNRRQNSNNQGQFVDNRQSIIFTHKQEKFQAFKEQCQILKQAEQKQQQNDEKIKASLWITQKQSENNRRRDDYNSKADKRSLERNELNRKRHNVAIEHVDVDSDGMDEEERESQYSVDKVYAVIKKRKEDKVVQINEEREAFKKKELILLAKQQQQQQSLKVELLKLQKEKNEVIQSIKQEQQVGIKCSNITNELKQIPVSGVALPAPSKFIINTVLNANTCALSHPPILQVQGNKSSEESVFKDKSQQIGIPKQQLLSDTLNKNIITSDNSVSKDIQQDNFIATTEIVKNEGNIRKETEVVNFVEGKAKNEINQDKFINQDTIQTSQEKDTGLSRTEQELQTSNQIEERKLDGCQKIQWQDQLEVQNKPKEEEINQLKEDIQHRGVDSQDIILKGDEGKDENNKVNTENEDQIKDVLYSNQSKIVPSADVNQQQNYQIKSRVQFLDDKQSEVAENENVEDKNQGEQAANQIISIAENESSSQDNASDSDNNSGSASISKTDQSCEEKSSSQEALQFSNNQSESLSDAQLQESQNKNNTIFIGNQVNSISNLSEATDSTKIVQKQQQQQQPLGLFGGNPVNQISKQNGTENIGNITTTIQNSTASLSSGNPLNPLIPPLNNQETQIQPTTQQTSLLFPNSTNNYEKKSVSLFSGNHSSFSSSIETNQKGQIRPQLFSNGPSQLTGNVNLFSGNNQQQGNLFGNLLTPGASGSSLFQTPQNTTNNIQQPSSTQQQEQLKQD